MDITRLSLAELKHLHAILPDEIEKRRGQDRERVIEELSALARARGFVLAELIPLLEEKIETASATKVARAVDHRRRAPIKYQHPRNAELAWAGRGQRPRWVAAWLAEGRTMTELKV